MKILVTGGTGLVGYAINQIKNLYPNYNFLFIGSSNCDLTNYEQTNAFFAKEKPDYVIHLAAYVGGLYKNLNYKVEMLEQNLLINFNVLKCCHLFQVKKCISTLSTCIFPDKTTYPINETMLHSGPPHDSNYSYAYAKRLLEVHSRSYREQYGDNFICIIPTNIYGPNDNYDLENAHVIPALIHQCHLSKKHNTPFIIRGTGKPLRQFIYSIDLAKLIMWTLENYNKEESIILSVGENDEISIENVARIIAKNFDYEHMIKFNSTFSDGQYKKTADNKTFLQLHGDFDFTSIEEGIKKSVNWFIKNKIRIFAYD